MNRVSLLKLVLIACFAVIPTGCFNYRFGQRTLYRQDIRTVYVPMIESDSLRRNLGERLTEAVVKEIENKTPFKVVHTPDADSTLRCRLANDQKRVVAESPTDEPRVAELIFQVSVDWVSRNGEPLSQTTQIVVPGSLNVGQTAEFIPEAGQSVATAQQAAIQRLAEQIVSQMQVWW